MAWMCGGGGGRGSSSGSTFSGSRRRSSGLPPIRLRSTPTKDGEEQPAGPSRAVPSDGHLIENGARLFEALIASTRGNINPIRMFSEKELIEATGNYDDRRFLGVGAYLVFSGNLDGRTVAVKIAASQNAYLFDMFIKEVVSLSQINHRNVVRLLGCCIETPSPILVYEHMSGGTLHQHLHDADSSRKMPWADRLRIAAEVADALSYLHTALRRPIVHGKIKTSSIFLDERNSAKVGTFGFSVVVSGDENERARRGSPTASGSLVGIHDRCDYFQPPAEAEKVDVFRFGMVLMELLTGKVPAKAGGGDLEARMMSPEHFVSSVRAGRTRSVLDGWIDSADGKQLEQALACAQLAVRSVAGTAAEWPTARELVRELRRIRGW